MPRVHGNIGRHSQNARRKRNVAARRTEEERDIERYSAQNRMIENRARRSEEINEAYNEQDRLRKRVVRARQRATIVRQQQILPMNIERAAFRYEPNIQYSAHASVQFGQMSVVCQHCNAVKFEKEPPGLCCANGKVKLPELLLPPEPLRTLRYGESPNSNHFLQHIKMYNDCFQMTSFGGEIVNEQNYNPTFKVISPTSAMNANTPTLTPQNTLTHHTQYTIHHDITQTDPYYITKYKNDRICLQLYRFMGKFFIFLDRCCRIQIKSTNISKYTFLEIQKMK